MSRINGFVGRRHFIKFVGLSTLTVSGISACSSIITNPSNITIPLKNPNPNPISPESAQRKLEEGNRRFYNQNRQYPNQTKRRLQSLSKTQYPFAAILGCADSRVPPELIFDQGLGDLFTVRVAGNIASNEAIGSLEYSTAALGTQLIVVLGHKQCGAVAAAIKNQPNPGRIGFIIDNIKPALAQEQPKNNDVQINESAIFNNIQYQTERLLKNSNILGQLVSDGRLKIIGAFYDTDTGKVQFLN